VLEAQADGVIFAATHPREIEAAERLLNILNWADLLRFGSSSSEMVQAGLRMARFSTGRTRFVRFHGHYHGWFDNIHIRSHGDSYETFGGGQLSAALADAVVLQWNDLSAFEAAVAADPEGLAAVIMEPMMFNAGAILPLPGFLEGVREICTRHGIVLIFDETISGFRVALGGAAQRFGVTPDLAVYGKAMAAGYPCAAIAGRRELFAGVSTGAVTHAGTFNGNVIATAAVLASLDELEFGDAYKQVETVGTQLMQGLVRLSDEHGLNLRVQGLPMAFHVGFNRSGRPLINNADVEMLDHELYGSLASAIIESGVWVSFRGIWYVSTAHTDADVRECLERVDRAMTSWVSTHDPVESATS
jgi:glutamate-1-semialdehyde 2,1-aminomutase